MKLRLICFLIFLTQCLNWQPTLDYRVAIDEFLNRWRPTCHRWSQIPVLHLPVPPSHVFEGVDCQILEKRFRSCLEDQNQDPLPCLDEAKTEWTLTQESLNQAYNHVLKHVEELDGFMSQMAHYDLPSNPYKIHYDRWKKCEQALKSFQSESVSSSNMDWKDVIGCRDLLESLHPSYALDEIQLFKKYDIEVPSPSWTPELKESWAQISDRYSDVGEKFWSDFLSEQIQNHVSTSQDPFKYFLLLIHLVYQSLERSQQETKTYAAFLLWLTLVSWLRGDENVPDPWRSQLGIPEVELYWQALFHQILEVLPPSIQDYNHQFFQDLLVWAKRQFLNKTPMSLQVWFQQTQYRETAFHTWKPVFDDQDLIMFLNEYPQRLKDWEEKEKLYGRFLDQISPNNIEEQHHEFDPQGEIHYVQDDQNPYFSEFQHILCDHLHGFRGFQKHIGYLKDYLRDKIPTDWWAELEKMSNHLPLFFKLHMFDVFFEYFKVSDVLEQMIQYLERVSDHLSRTESFKWIRLGVQINFLRENLYFLLRAHSILSWLDLINYEELHLPKGCVPEDMKDNFCLRPEWPSLYVSLNDFRDWVVNHRFQHNIQEYLLNFVKELPLRDKKKFSILMEIGEHTWFSKYRFALLLNKEKCGISLAKKSVLPWKNPKVLLEDGFMRLYVLPKDQYERLLEFCAFFTENIFFEELRELLNFRLSQAPWHRGREDSPSLETGLFEIYEGLDAFFYILQTLSEFEEQFVFFENVMQALIKLNDQLNPMQTETP